MIDLINKLYETNSLELEEYKYLLGNLNEENREYLRGKAQNIAKANFSNHIYMRGLIEFTNYCKQDCYYCGIRKSNSKAERYRLTEDEILQCCQVGYDLGFRTFVLQGGEDGFYTDEKMESIIKEIKKNHPDCAITLSIGEKDYKTYERFYKAGADRYLLRHETADEEHYKKLHPSNLSLENRKKCLYNLKEIGYQVGTGLMVGSPYQTLDDIAKDLKFIEELKPHMVGIGPYITHKDTPFKEYESGDLDLTLAIISILRLMLPKALIPSTTALGTISKIGREKGILAGANVVMPNLSPVSVREKYSLYDNKICTGEEAAECRGCLGRRIDSIGYEIVVSRGDY